MEPTPRNTRGTYSLPINESKARSPSDSPPNSISYHDLSKTKGYNLRNFTDSSHNYLYEDDKQYRSFRAYNLGEQDDRTIYGTEQTKGLENKKSTNLADIFVPCEKCGSPIPKNLASRSRLCPLCEKLYPGKRIQSQVSLSPVLPYVSDFSNYLNN